jgi:hypothetical protein
MRYDTILTSSAGILTERGSDYGAPEKCFGRAAALASVAAAAAAAGALLSAASKPQAAAETPVQAAA